MILLIDNYDSFVHNLARYFERLGQQTIVVRNDGIDIADVRSMQPDAVVISPGPCTPREAGISLSIVRALASKLPMLGVCLGHQVIADALGGQVVRATRPVHGQACEILHESRGIFAGLPSPTTVGRYHSLIVEPSSLPVELRPTAWTRDGVLMAFEHVDWPVFGVQFHPESILTECGFELLANFLRFAGLTVPMSASDLAPSERPVPTTSAPALPAGPVTF